MLLASYFYSAQTGGTVCDAVSYGTSEVMTSFSNALEDPLGREVYESKWARGGFGFMGAYGDLMLDQAANDTDAQCASSCGTRCRLAPCCAPLRSF